MLLALKLKAGLTAAILAAPLAVSAIPANTPAPLGRTPDIIVLAPGTVAYRPAGDFSRG